MSAAVVGALRVTLGIDTAQFETGLKGANASLKSVGATMKKVGAVIGVAVAGAAAGLALAFNRVSSEADQLGKSAQTLGLPVEELSRLKHAADLSGLSFEDMSTGLTRLNRAMSDAAQNAKGATAKAFAQIGVSATDADGKLRPTSDVIDDLADRFARMPNGAQKTALAMQLLGRQGAAMIPLLNGGASGLKAMKDEADALGITIDTKTARSAEAFNDNLTRLARIKDGIVTRMTAGMLPAFERLSTLLVEASTKTTIFKTIGGSLGAVMEGIGRALIFAWDNMAIFARVAGVFIGLKLAGVTVSIGLAMLNLAKAVRNAGIISAVFAAIMRAKRTAILATAAGIAYLTGQLPAFEGAMQKVNAVVARVAPEGLGKEAAAALEKLGLDTSALTADFAALKIETGNSEAALAGLEGAMTSTGNAAAPLGQKVSAALTGMKESVREFTQVLETNFMSAFDSFVEGTFNAREALAGLVKDLGRMAASQAVQSLLGTGSSGGGLGGLLTNLFSGGGTSIGTASLEGFATGGNFKVGGYGGIDSQLVAFRATPGEMVDIKRPGDRTEPRVSEAASPITITMNVTTPDAASFRRSESQIAGMLSRAVSRGARNR